MPLTRYQEFTEEEQHIKIRVGALRRIENLATLVVVPHNLEHMETERIKMLETFQICTTTMPLSVTTSKQSSDS